MTQKFGNVHNIDTCIKIYLISKMLPKLLYSLRLFLSFECNEQSELDLINVLSIPSPVLKKMIFSLILLCNYLFYVANFRKQPRDCFQEFCWHRHQGSKRKSNLSTVFRAS